MITIPRRAAAVLLSAGAMMILCGGLPLIAQESGRAPADARVKKTAKRATDPVRRVPNYFGQLGLSDTQKESIYRIQAKHQPRIDSLEKQLEEARAQMMRECEAVLNEQQRKMLNDRRSGAAESRAKKGASAGTEAKPKS